MEEERLLCRKGLAREEALAEVKKEVKKEVKTEVIVRQVTDIYLSS